MDSLLERADDVESLAVLSRFRLDLHACLTARRDELFELADAVLYAEGPVRTLAGLSLAPEHRRGHGALYDAVNHGRIEIGRLRRSLAGLALPRAADGRLMLAADVSSWLRPGAATSPQRLFCHVYGRGKGQAQMAGEPVGVEVADHIPNPVLASKRHLRDRHRIHALRRQQHHLRPPPGHYRPAAPADDPHQPPALVIIDLTHPHAFAHPASLKDQPGPRQLTPRGRRPTGQT
jgi:hypothetical protein